MNVPDHVYSEIVKLNGVEFKSKQLVLEEVKTKHKNRTPSVNVLHVPHQMILSITLSLLCRIHKARLNQIF